MELTFCRHCVWNVSIKQNGFAFEFRRLFFSLLNVKIHRTRSEEGIRNTVA